MLWLNLGQEQNSCREKARPQREPVSCVVVLFHTSRAHGAGGGGGDLCFLALCSIEVRDLDVDANWLRVHSQLPALLVGRCQ